DGNCNLGKGFRAYFEFVSNLVDSSPDSTTFGDGFTFSIISGVYDTVPGTYRNTKYDTGGPLGEYLGYAGPGLSIAEGGVEKGIKPPKIALEIDTFPNPGAGSICSSNSRNDGPPEANHIALDYWGEDTPGSLDAVGGSYMRIGSESPADGSPEDWSSTVGTISFWFKRDTTNYGDGTSSGDRLWGQDANMETRFDSTGTTFNLDWGSGGNAEGAIAAGNPFTGVGTWYFMAITWDDDTERLQVFWGDETTPTTLLSENLIWTGDMSPLGGLITENLFMNSSGGDGLKNYAVDGNGSDLRYYNVELTLAQLENVRLFGSEPGLQSNFPLQSDFANAATSTPASAAVGDTQWSQDTPSGFDCGTGAATYDDNRHGAGGGTTQPMNSLNTHPGSGDDGYYQVVKAPLDDNWMEDGLLYGVRLELIRPKLPNGSVYEYQIKAWTVCVDATCSDLDAVQKANFSDTRATYDGSDPQIELTLKKGNPLELAESVHQDLKSILFGFTQGTSGATQDITLKNMDMRFIKTYPVSDLSTW
ncbi:MAG: hypothetical protein JRE12_10405, partial [Deltaproteobacteria bacterium]|nr:hypothetical protein [Deltaproteobacteria bacterium]